MSADICGLCASVREREVKLCDHHYITHLEQRVSELERVLANLHAGATAGGSCSPSEGKD